MFDLPIIVFKLQGDNNYIELTAEDVSKDNYLNDYIVEGLLEIKAGIYSASKQGFIFETKQIYDFYHQMKNCYDSLDGEVVLENMDLDLSITVSFGKMGRVVITGSYQEYPHINTKLCFEITSNQSYIPDALKNMQNFFDNLRVGCKN